MTYDVNTLTNENQTRRVVISYDESHDYPSNWDDIWGSVVFTEFRTQRMEWKGRDYSGVVDAHRRWGLREDIARRYLRAFHDILITEIEYARGDFGWIVTERMAGEPVEDWEGRHEGNTDVWMTYLSGEVYTVTLQESVTWYRGDDSDDETMMTWETVDSLSGNAGYDYALTVARDTLSDDGQEIVA